MPLLRSRRLLLLAAVLLGRAGPVPMSDDVTRGGPPTFGLTSPGVGTTDDPEAFESPHGLYWIQLGPGRRLSTVEWFEGRHSEEALMRAQAPVDWEVSVPWGARLFSVTSGASVARVRQFWVGWVDGGHVSMEALDGWGPVASSLDGDEASIFPAVMDGKGTASFYSWKPTDYGSALRERVFSSSAAPPRTVIEIPGRPVVSRIATVPGRLSRHALVGWVEHDEAAGVVLGLVVLDEGRATVFRSSTMSGVAAFAEQRIGVWAAGLDRAEVAAVVVSVGDPQAYSIARFRIEPATPKGASVTEALNLGPGQLLRAAVDHYRRGEDPDYDASFLKTDGRLVDRQGVLQRHVPLDSVLPIVTSWRCGAWWAARGPDGSVKFESIEKR